ncbi:serine hydrolase domain-containing protein [Actinomadura rifamycini]|uniref:serine hydrolase domain-containing protein n=1 Tax=Actinomadura rifamycini TaxID=31962 RepID=UPI0004181F25|nr:serine hydrolase domain-containing protein [Actinomadura rifamycini]
MLRKAIAVAGLAGLVAAGTAVPAAAGEDRPRLRRLLHTLTAEDGAPGALAAVRDRRGRTVLTSGVGDVRTGAPVPREGHWRIGSITKTFTATAVLLLVEDGLVDLDAPVERYLPGTVRGNGHDGRNITVRQLLQHTSGLPDYLDHLGIGRIVENPLERHDRDDLLALALAHPPEFAPGTGWSYSNTGYLLAGLVVEAVTGDPLADVVERRVLDPLRLDDTGAPGAATGLPSPHPRGYVRLDGTLLDRTRLSASTAWGGGDLVSDASDLNRFFTALVGGRVLRPGTLREMMRTTEVSPEYGLGLRRVPRSCGAPVWGHAGDMVGFSTLSGATRHGRGATVTVNVKPGLSDAGEQRLKDAFDAALCDD